MKRGGNNIDSIYSIPSSKILLFLTILSVITLISVNSVNAQTGNYCAIVDRGACGSSEEGGISNGNIILGLSSDTNAHGELASENNYNYALCCTFGGGQQDPYACEPDNANKILNLSSSTNAHAESPNANPSNFDVPVCYGGVNVCFATTAACADDEVKIATLSSDTDTNAHLGSSYNNKICCRVDRGAQSCTLSNAYWSLDGTTELPDSDGDGIGDTTAIAGQKAYLVVEGNSDTCKNVDVSFVVEENDKGSASNTLETTKFDSNGVAVGVWNAEFIDDGVGQGNPEYFFEASLTNNPTTITSSDPLLEVEESAADCSENKINLCSKYNKSENYRISVDSARMERECNADPCSASETSQGDYCGWDSGICYAYTSGDDPTTPPQCGDREITGDEQCDDGNTESGDGCSSTCVVEDGYVCSSNPSECSLGDPTGTCGDGTTQSPNEDGINEQCDDGNTESGDGCSSTCQEEGGDADNDGYSDAYEISVGTDPNDPNDNPGGSCRYNEDTSDDCSDGFLTYSWTATWTGSSPAPSSCQDGSQTIECPAQVQLPFFGVYNFIIAALLVAAIYAIAALSDRKNRKKLMKVFE